MKELITKYIDKEAVIHTGGLEVMVKIIDIKVSYGKTRYLVTPLNGNGQVWVEQIKFA